jgi:hypothetical protein
VRRLHGPDGRVADVHGVAAMSDDPDDLGAKWAEEIKLEAADIGPDRSDYSWLDSNPDVIPEKGATPLIVSALDAATEATVGEWLLRPYLEADVLALMYGDYGTLKSFVAVDWSMRIGLGWPAIGYQFKREPQDVVYISAEGKGLWKRLRSWCIRNCPGESWRDVLKRACVYVIRRPLNLSAEQEVVHLAAQIEELGIKPALVIVDTLSRNSNGEPEKSTDAATSYLNNLDRGLRVYFGASVLFVHHVGHGDKDRHRGPIVLAANTDAEIRVVRPDKGKLEVTLEVVRLKDSDLPPPAGLKGVVVELGELDCDGQQITSLAIEGMDEAPGQQRNQQPGGKNQRELLAAIRGHGAEIITRHELHGLAKAIGMSRWDTRDAAISGLEQRQLLLPCVGGFKVAP